MPPGLNEKAKVPDVRIPRNIYALAMSMRQPQDVTSDAIGSPSSEAERLDQKIDPKSLPEARSSTSPGRMEADEEKTCGPTGDGEDLASRMGTITVCLDVAASTMPSPAKNELLSYRGSGMDMTPLETLQRKLNQPGSGSGSGTCLPVPNQAPDEKYPVAAGEETALARLIDDMTAISRLLQAEQRVDLANDDDDGRRSESTGVDRRSAARATDASHLAFLRGLLRYTAAHPSTNAAALPTVLTEPTVANLWIRERMQQRWQQRYRSAAYEEEEEEEEEEDEEKEEAASPSSIGFSTASATARQARRPAQPNKLLKQLFKECGRAQLAEVKHGLDAAVLTHLHELDSLHTHREALLLLLLLLPEPHPTTVAADLLIPFLDLHHPVPPALAPPHIVDTHLHSLSHHLHGSRRAVSSLTTHMHGLLEDNNDNDVCDHRLAQPATATATAVMHLADATSDLVDLRAQIQLTLAACDELCAALDAVADQAVRKFRDTQRAWWIVAGGKE
ncbi:MAG: hypothetical protein M1826_002002 [Phylliscum demangeonii]|nr:MAG: hypothetical protein M1826_002002 [Phylliscum demangeonii]